MRIKQLLLALIAALCIGSAHASIALVQHAQANANSTSIAVTLSGVSTGDTLIVELVSNSGAFTPSSVVDSSGNTVSTAVTFATESVHAGLGVYYVQNASAGAHTITVSWSSTNSATIFLEEYSGLLTSGVFDTATSVNFGSTTSISTGSITPAGNGELIILGIGQQNNAETYSSFTNGFTQEDSYNTEAPAGTWAALVQSTAASVNGGATSSSTNGSAAAIAAFKPASAAGFTVVAQAEASSTTAQTSLATGTSLNVQTGDRFCAVIASKSSTPPSLIDTAGDQFAFGGAQTPQSGYYLYAYQVQNGTANSADTFTAQGTSIFAIAVLQLRGLVSSPLYVFPTAPAGIAYITGGAGFNDNSQVAPGTGTDAVTSASATPPAQPAAVIGFSAIPGEGGSAVNAAPNAGTGFTAQTGVWETWGGGAGDYLGVFETELITNSTPPVSATFTAPTYGAGNYGTFIWVIPQHP